MLSAKACLQYALFFRERKKKETHHWKTLSLRQAGEPPSLGIGHTSHHHRTGLQDCKHHGGKCGEWRIKKVSEINRGNVLWPKKKQNKLKQHSGACSDSWLLKVISYDYLGLDVDKSPVWGSCRPPCLGGTRTSQGFGEHHCIRQKAYPSSRYTRVSIFRQIWVRGSTDTCLHDKKETLYFLK